MIELNYCLRLEPLNLESGGQTAWVEFHISYFTPQRGHMAPCHVISLLKGSPSWPITWVQRDDPFLRSILGPILRVQAPWIMCHLWPIS